MKLKMKFWEALEIAHEENKRVRAKAWGPYDYIWIDEKGDIVDESGQKCDFDQEDVASEWEVYEEEKARSKTLEEVAVTAITRHDTEIKNIMDRLRALERKVL